MASVTSPDMAKKSISELKKEIADLELQNKEIEERNKLNQKLAGLKQKSIPKKRSVRSKVRKFFGENIAGSLDASSSGFF